MELANLEIDSETDLFFWLFLVIEPTIFLLTKRTFLPLDDRDSYCCCYYSIKSKWPSNAP